MCVPKKKIQSVLLDIHAVANICTIVLTDIYAIAVTVAYIHTLVETNIRTVAKIDIRAIAVTVAYICVVTKIDIHAVSVTYINAIAEIEIRTTVDIIYHIFL